MMAPCMNVKVLENIYDMPLKMGFKYAWLGGMGYH